MEAENQPQTEQLEIKPEDQPQAPTPADGYTPSERFIAAVGYISFLCLLPLILRRDSEYCQFHGKQGLFVCIIFFALRFFFILPYIGTILTIFEVISIIVMVILAWQGNKFRIPFLADKAEQLKLTREEEQEAEMLKEQTTLNTNN